MGDKFLRITTKELFYAAMMLHLDQLINVEYLFPADDTKLTQELTEAKQSLRKKKLLKESAKSGVTLGFALSICVAFCTRPNSTAMVSTEGYTASIYEVGGIYMLLEREEEDGLAATWFMHAEQLNNYLASRTGGGAEGMEPEETANEELSERTEDNGRA